MDNRVKIVVFTLQPRILFPGIKARKFDPLEEWAGYYSLVVEFGGEGTGGGYGWGGIVKKPFLLYPVKEGEAMVAVFPFNCYGEGVPKKDAYKLIRTRPPVDQGWVDIRTLGMIQGGCCPPELMKDFIMQEGALVERDPVEEAMKLHKRGYFGGGG